MKLYPWENWLKRRTQFKLHKGKDFDCAPHSMSIMVRQRAIEHGLRASVLIQEQILVITFTEGKRNGTHSRRDRKSRRGTVRRSPLR